MSFEWRGRLRRKENASSISLLWPAIPFPASPFLPSPCASARPLVPLLQVPSSTIPTPAWTSPVISEPDSVPASQDAADYLRLHDDSLKPPKTRALFEVGDEVEFRARPCLCSVGGPEAL